MQLHASVAYPNDAHSEVHNSLVVWATDQTYYFSFVCTEMFLSFFFSWFSLPFYWSSLNLSYMRYAQKIK